MRNEKKIEDDFVKYAKSLEVYCPKFATLGRKGVADRLVHLPGGYAFYIEFKDPEGETSPHQEDFQEDMESRAIESFIVDSFDEAKELLDDRLITEFEMKDLYKTLCIDCGLLGE